MEKNNSIMENITEKISSAKSSDLCEVIASNIYLHGIFDKEAVLCMKELADRRNNGEIFDYESHIESRIKEYPRLDSNIINIIKSGFNLQVFLKK